jgi:hypothetical protein
VQKRLRIQPLPEQLLRLPKKTRELLAKQRKLEWRFELGLGWRLGLVKALV